LPGDVRQGHPQLAAEDHLAGARPRGRRGPDDALGPGTRRRRAGGDLRGDPGRREARHPRLEPLDDLRQYRRAQPRRDRLLPAPQRKLMPGVEAYGVEPIPAELRTAGWRDPFALNVTFFTI